MFEKTFRGQYVDQLEAFTKTFRRSQVRPSTHNAAFTCTCTHTHSHIDRIIQVRPSTFFVFSHARSALRARSARSALRRRGMSSNDNSRLSALLPTRFLSIHTTHHTRHTRQLFITSTSLLVSNTTGIMERLRKFMLLPSDPAFEEPLPHDDHIKVRPSALLCVCELSILFFYRSNDPSHAVSIDPSHDASIWPQ